jgi:hypothetical protein
MVSRAARTPPPRSSQLFHQVRLADAVDHDVRRLEISVCDTDLMRVAKDLTHLAGNGQRELERQLIASNHRCEINAFDRPDRGRECGQRSCG